MNFRGDSDGILLSGRISYCSRDLTDGTHEMDDSRWCRVRNQKFKLVSNKE
jgi:hypothetical protein